MQFRLLASSVVSWTALCGVVLAAPDSPHFNDQPAGHRAEPVAVVTLLPEILMPARFHVNTPWQLGVIGRGNTVIGMGAAGRLMAYNDRAFVLADFEVGVPISLSTVTHSGSLNIGYVLPLGETTSLQPFFGTRLLNIGSNWMTGVSYGAIAYFRPVSNWDYFAIARGTNSLSGLWGSATVGADYALSPGIALTFEGAYRLLPSTLDAPMGTPFGNDPAITGTVGVSMAF